LHPSFSIEIVCERLRQQERLIGFVIVDELALISYRLTGAERHLESSEEIA
jgi:hypothetical protein